MSFEDTRYVQRKLERDAQETRKRNHEMRQLNDRLTQDNTTRTAADNITYTREHVSSMTDALIRVRQNKSTIADGLYMMPNNHGGKLL